MKAEFLLAVLLAAAPAAARSRAPKSLPDADALLLKALEAPDFAYAATAREQTFQPGRKPRGLGVEIRVLPGGRRRCAVRKSPRKPPELIFVSLPGRVAASWPKLGKTWAGPVLEETPREQLARYKALYALQVSTGGRVAKRPTWRINLLSARGTLRRSLWVDRDTGLLVKRETYRLDGGLARRERLTRLDVGVAADADGFELAASSGALSPTALKAGGTAFRPFFPRWIPEGFLPVFLRASAGEDGRPPTIGLDYSDGGEGFTFAQYPGTFELRAGKPGERIVALKNGAPALLGADSAGAFPTLTWNQGGRVCFLAGSLAEDELARVADSVTAEAP